MGEQALDTSGSVVIDNGKHTWREITWTDLSPFQQGYVEAALLAVQWPDPAEGFGPSSSVIRFDWLAPATLAAMLRDCEAWLRDFGGPDTAAHGHGHFEGRQNGVYADVGFPPVTLSLGDDGLIYATGASQ